MENSSADLLDLAREKFSPRNLSTAEERLFRAVETGTTASSMVGNNDQDDPATAAEWDAERIVRAECIEWLCTNPAALAKTTHVGLWIEGMRIDGVLNLNNANVDFAIWASKCAFTNTFILHDARLAGLFLPGCHTRDIVADRLKVRGAVLLRAGFRATGAIRLLAAEIGSLECDGAQISNPNGLAVVADGICVRGGVFLRAGFGAEGEVRFSLATIEGNLDCEGAQFSNPEGAALLVDSSTIEGEVFLRGAKVVGHVRLIGATITGSLDCARAHLSNPTRVALDIDRARIDGAIFLRDGFMAEGEVRLLGAHIGQNFECGAAQFLNPQGQALNAERAKIEGNVFLRDGFRADGQVDLSGAAISGNLQIHHLSKPLEHLDLRWVKTETLWDDESAWPKGTGLFLDGFTYARLHENSPLDANARIGWLNRQAAASFLPQPYEHLASVLRQMGHEREARSIMVEKNRARGRRARFPRQDWWWYTVFGRAVGYGYRPLKAFAWSVLIIVFGALLFRLAFSYGLMSPTKEAAYQTTPVGVVDRARARAADDYSVFNSWAYSLESFTPFLKLDQSANWQPNANRGAIVLHILGQSITMGALVRYYLWLHIIAGWVLTALWVGAVTGFAKT